MRSSSPPAPPPVSAGSPTVPALEALRAVGAKAAVLHVPIGSDNGFRGVVDVLSGRAFLYQGDSGTFQEGTVPAELADTVAKAREQLVETIAEANDVLLEQHLEGTELATDALVTGLRDGTLERNVLPVLCGAAGPPGGLQPPLHPTLHL